MKLTDGQRLLLGELAPWQLLALADAPEYWCKHIRDMQGGGTPVDPDWRAAGVWRATYSWGMAITALGDYMHERKRDDPAHKATLTWAEITRWVESLPAELRAEARRQRKLGIELVSRVVDQILAHGITEPEPTLW
ncbi:hypothetical protein Mbo4_057 [Rhodococcus phage Mbo4]|uniref:Uncharacterized protein n=2 Tax=root TaxID=1 RepID=A0A9E7LA07_9CAUD|nr:hypothetical protein [Rhodococcus opacus]YP_010755962.1 hypothetical protein QEH50_gp57 [Rhodococcus phage Mbo4]EKT83061.1 hypothetical protein WSS_A09097 [Rhodococcus opacus M213]URG17547.1 hypothetical protein Mbo4_057 [Rhodococcus phage Mbo4]